ncbi:copper-binding protein [Variovorax sp. PCZ-1]|uniref:copper-binding protein n=1 Tax=Variovorax sp. PCZ-1 TaxID=2835533 RepID=UPI001BCAA4BA|nr:copper-binding protein [Variovorax sp. PCZ-1]MBS7806367.1 copper-binding protein [Variovorax sp. PCZ-1]
MSSLFLRGLALALLAISSAFAQTNAAKPATPAAVAPTAIEWVNGEITKLDAPRSRITLKHERIASIKMDAMTMPFKVKDKALLDGRKVGEKVQFAVRMDDGDLFITQMRAMP